MSLPSHCLLQLPSKFLRLYCKLTLPPSSKVPLLVFFLSFFYNDGCPLPQRSLSWTDLFQFFAPWLPLKHLIEALRVPDRRPIIAGYAPTRCSCHPRGPRKVLSRFIDSPHSI
ncbi:hypothetical protein M434DRAFT_336841 [Hypoxylon sp. CO27-5]|nr:hypothetical protein M434DRAFT_336841 [Hypoxylon sp. CO27-5]